MSTSEDTGMYYLEEYYRILFKSTIPAAVKAKAKGDLDFRNRYIAFLHKEIIDAVDRKTGIVDAVRLAEPSTNMSAFSSKTDLDADRVFQKNTRPLASEFKVEVSGDIKSKLLNLIMETLKEVYAAEAFPEYGHDLQLHPKWRILLSELLNKDIHMVEDRADLNSILDGYFNICTPCDTGERNLYRSFKRVIEGSFDIMNVGYNFELKKIVKKN
jgi:hypothetical protein